MNVIKAVAPAAAIQQKCNDTKPIRVSVSIQKDGCMVSNPCPLAFGRTFG